MARHTNIAILLFVLLMGPFTRPSGPATGSETDEIAAIKKQCDERNRALGADIGDSKDAMDKFEAMLGALEKAAEKEPELATAAASVPPAQAIQEAKTVQESVRAYVGAAEKMQTRAAQEVSLAEKEINPTQKVKHYQQAITYLNQGKSLSERAVSTMQERLPGTSHINFNSRAFDQANAMVQALAGNDSSSRLDVLNQAWDGSAKHATQTVIRGGNTAFFSGPPTAYANGTITTQNGRKIDVSAIERAAVNGQQSPVHQPLMRPVPTPGGGTSYMVNPAVYNRARAASADPKVGGVDLQVKFLALDAAGVSGFQSGSYLEGVDQTVLLSLKNLLARLQPSASDPKRWASLPKELRFPGGIERIIGYVLDRARGDVVIIGVPAQRPEARMDIDTIILGLRASWRDNKNAYVSLDPLPFDPFGPQLSRVGGVPQDSIMAWIMLNADYMMKEILLGKRQTDVAGYKTVIQMQQANQDLLSHPWRARFWFYPKPLSPYCVAASASGRTVTFNAELQVLSEQMEMQGGAFVSAGTDFGPEEAAAFEFTRDLDAFSASTKTDPDAMFTRLRGLTGIVTLGALLRKAGIDYSVLKQFTDLPYRHLEGAQAAPKQYPGVVAEFDFRAQNRIWRISIGGGVSLVPRLRRSSQESSVDLLAAHLEPKVDSGEVLKSDGIREAIPVVLARTDTGVVSQRADSLLLQGSAAFRKGQVEEAARNFREAAEIDPSSVDAYINLAFSLHRTGRNQEARAAIHTARLLEPEDQAAQLIEYAIRRSDKLWPGPDNPKKVRRELLNLYIDNARVALLQNPSYAYNWAKDAIALGPEEAAAEAYLIRGFVSLKRAPEAPDEACKDLRTAWEATEYVGLSGGSYDSDDRIYALACVGLAHCAVYRQAAELKTGDPGPALFRSVAADIKQSIDYMKPAQKLYPELSLVFTAALELESIRYSLLKMEYRPEAKQSEKARLVTLGEDILRHFPDSADAHSALSQLYLDMDDAGKAIDISSRWLTKHPHDTTGLTLRGTALAQLGKCAEARQDLSSAAKDPQFKGLPTEFKSRCGAL
jgi:Flp pilus assembly protein TadD